MASTGDSPSSRATPLTISSMSSATNSGHSAAVAAMPARAVSAGLKEELHNVASSASRDDSIPGAYGEESSEISISSDSPGKPPKGTPQASSHGTPAGGSIHLDIPSSSDTDGTVLYDDQVGAEMDIKKGNEHKYSQIPAYHRNRSWRCTM